MNFDPEKEFDNLPIPEKYLYLQAKIMSGFYIGFLDKMTPSKILEASDFELNQFLHLEFSEYPPNTPLIVIERAKILFGELYYNSLRYYRIVDKDFQLSKLAIANLRKGAQQMVDGGITSA